MGRCTSSESLSSPRISDDVSMQDPAESRLTTPIAASRERVCLALRRMFAQATILIVTRGFRTELASGYSDYIRAGGRLPISELMAPEAGPYAAAFFDYDAVVSLYEQAFGEEAVIALPYELLRDDPSAFVGVLEGLLGLEPQGVPVSSLNPSLSPASIITGTACCRVAWSASLRVWGRV